MNYTDKKPYTRICEYGNLLVKEYPSKKGDPYYPVDIENPYSLITDENVIFGGRLAEYKYYNMDQIIEKAIYDCTKSIR
jgi:UDP-galactopyranose mutase